MKRMFIALALAAAMVMPSWGMGRDEAVRRATYLTTMMIADLAMPEQYRQAVYLANLDYMMGLRGNGDLYSHGWKARNKRLRKLMRQQQWNRYVATHYYRPVGWGGNGFVFYFGAPAPPPPPPAHHPRYDSDDWEDFFEDLEDDYKDRQKHIKKQHKKYKKYLKKHNKKHRHHHDDDDDD